MSRPLRAELLSLAARWDAPTISEPLRGAIDAAPNDAVLLVEAAAIILPTAPVPRLEAELLDVLRRHAARLGESLATAVLTAHQRRGGGGCLCGRLKLGESWAAHVAEVLDAAGALRDRPPGRNDG